MLNKHSLKRTKGLVIGNGASSKSVMWALKKYGIPLDAVYTGKAFAGLLKMAAENKFTPEMNVLFIHTGGAGGLFAVH